MLKLKEKYRVVICFALISALLFLCATRIFMVNSAGYTEVQQQNNSYRITLSKLRGTIFDCNMQPITNSATYTVSAFLPNESAALAAAGLDKDNAARVLASLKKGLPDFSITERAIDNYGVYSTSVYANIPDNMLCPQLIGYLDADGHGVSGIQKAYDSLLYSGEHHSLLVATNGLGVPLAGGEFTEIINKSIINSGLKLTINGDIQQIVARCMQSVKCGAAVVSEVGSGKIRAMVSMPEFNAKQVELYLNNEDSPFINRALTAYNVGSVFKPCVAAAAIESGRSSYTCSCQGVAEFSGHSFRCHTLSGHGTLDITNALAYSCNVFFYNAAVNLGADSVFNMASSLGFSKGYEIGAGISCSAQLTDISVLRSNERALVNLSIGQGDLMLSPVSILSLYEAIANGGIYRPQTVVEGTVKNGATTAFLQKPPTRVMSTAAANRIKNDLSAVLEYGTGTAAKPQYVTAAGKTATAQTGWRKNGEAVENSWFCGFFPKDNPKYVVAVLIEASKGKEDTAAPIFAAIADGITVLENSKK